MRGEGDGERKAVLGRSSAKFGAPSNDVSWLCEPRESTGAPRTPTALRCLGWIYENTVNWISECYVLCDQIHIIGLNVAGRAQISTVSVGVSTHDSAHDLLSETGDNNDEPTTERPQKR